MTILSRVHQICDDVQLDVHKLCGLGSGRASIMFGVLCGGVSSLLKQETPFLVANYCIARRLVLACGQAANEIPYLKQFKDNIILVRIMKS